MYAFATVLGLTFVKRTLWSWYVVLQLLMRSTWGSSLGEDKLGARDRILNTEVAHQARTGQTFPPKSPLGFGQHVCRLCLRLGGVDQEKNDSRQRSNHHLLGSTWQHAQHGAPSPTNGTNPPPAVPQTPESPPTMAALPTAVPEKEPMSPTTIQTPLAPGVRAPKSGWLCMPTCVVHSFRNDHARSQS